MNILELFPQAPIANLIRHAGVFVGTHWPLLGTVLLLAIVITLHHLLTRD